MPGFIVVRCFVSRGRSRDAISLFVGLSFLVILAGCTSATSNSAESHGPTSTPTPINSVSMSPTPTGSQFGEATLVSRRLTLQPGLGAYGFTADDQLITQEFTGSPGDRRETNGILNVVDGTSRVIRSKVDSYSEQAPWAAGDSRAVILMATGATTDESPGTAWKMLSFDRSSGQLKIIARSQRVRGFDRPPTVPGYPQPNLLGGRVYWLEAVGGPRHPHLVTYSMPAGGGQRREELRDLWQPNPTSYGLVALDSGLLHGDATGGSFTVFVKKGGSTHELYAGELRENQRMIGLTASDAGVAWLVQEQDSDDVTKSRLFILSKGGTTPLEIQSPQGTSWYGLVSSRDFIGWYDGNESGDEYIAAWTGESQLLGSAPGLAQVILGNRFVAWAVSRPGGRALAIGSPVARTR